MLRHHDRSYIFAEYNQQVEQPCEGAAVELLWIPGATKETIGYRQTKDCIGKEHPNRWTARYCDLVDENVRL